MSRFLNVVIAGLTAATLASPRQQSGESRQPLAESTRSVVVNVQFDGGTMAEYVHAVREAAGGANIVVMPEAVEIALPPIQLTSVSLSGALELIEGQFQRKDAPSVNVRVVELIPTGEFDKGMFRVSADSSGPTRRSKSPEVHVWTLSGLLARGMQPEDVLAAVETTLDLFVGGGEPAQIRFHEPTGVLIASGQESQLRAIEQVLDRLSEGIHERSDAEAESREQPLAQAATEIELLRHELLTLREALERSTKRIHQLESRAGIPAGK